MSRRVKTDRHTEDRRREAIDQFILSMLSSGMAHRRVNMTQHDPDPTPPKDQRRDTHTTGGANGISITSVDGRPFVPVIPNQVLIEISSILNKLLTDGRNSLGPWDFPIHCSRPADESINNASSWAASSVIQCHLPTEAFFFLLFPFLS